MTDSVIRNMDPDDRESVVQLLGESDPWKSQVVLVYIARSVHAHPTLPEAVREAALAVAKRAIHI